MHILIQNVPYNSISVPPNVVVVVVIDSHSHRIDPHCHSVPENGMMMMMPSSIVEMNRPNSHVISYPMIYCDKSFDNTIGPDVVVVDVVVSYR